MEVTLNGSGAIDNLTYTVEAVEAPGDDLLFGGKGDDTILGEDGDDTLKGESGNDDLFGGAGDDSIRGGSGSDEIDGGSGADTINGGDDADTIIGGTAGDIVDGGSGGCDEDTLDLSGIGLFELVDVVPDSNGNGYNGVVNFLDDDLNVTASFEFYEIENIIGTPVSRSPEANPDIAEVDEDGSVDIDVLSNDTDPDNDISELTVTGANAGNGSVTVNADGTLTYEPAADFNGTDTIEYAITDPDGNTAIGTVTVTVNPVNDDPVAQDDVSSTDYQTAVNIDVLSNDSDIDGDTLEVIDAHTDDGSVMINDDGTLLFIPDDGFFGDAVIEYTVADNAGGFDTAQVIVTVSEAAPGRYRRRDRRRRRHRSGLHR